MVKRSRRVVLAAGLVGLVAALTLVIAGAATAEQGYDGPANQVYEAGSPSCPAGTADAGSTLISSDDLVTDYNDGRIHIARRSVENGIDSFDWQLYDHTVLVMAVIVQGEGGAYVYYFNTPNDSPFSDDNLAPPLDSNGESHISHAEFCFDPKHGDNPALSVAKSASGTSQIEHHWSIDKQVKVAGADDSTYGDNAVLNLPDGGNGSVTWKVTVTDAPSQTYAVTGTITVSNASDVAVTGVDVSDSITGAAIDCAGNGSTGLTVPAQGSIQCSYSVAPGSQVANNTATATWGTDSSASATATIQWADPTESGVPAQVTDDGGIDQSLDTGDLTNNQWTTTYDEGWRCANGKPSPNNGRTNVATVTWNNGSDSDSASASVQVGCGTTPPPQPPVTPPHGPESMDVQIVKNATSQVQLVNGQADIAYTMVVRNNGPNQAHNVVVSDAAPGGVTFLGVTAQPVNGSCTATAVTLDCSLGTLGPGVERTIGVSARVTQAGTYVNCATVTGEGGDTNAANNRSCAETVVTAPAVQPVTPPFTPPVTPKPKPKPKPKPNLCRVLKINTKLVKANGHKHGIVAKVTRSRNPVKGVKVHFKGAGVSKAARTNKKGVARITVKTNKAGIIRVNIVNVKACNTARIGVIGVFQPPVTG
jgi:uncharacterized repeat protein (TIGR01451 family)